MPIHRCGCFYENFCPEKVKFLSFLLQFLTYHSTYSCAIDVTLIKKYIDIIIFGRSICWRNEKFFQLHLRSLTFHLWSRVFVFTDKILHHVTLWRLISSVIFDLWLPGNRRAARASTAFSWTRHRASCLRPANPPLISSLTCKVHVHCRISCVHVLCSVHQHSTVQLHRALFSKFFHYIIARTTSVFVFFKFL